MTPEEFRAAGHQLVDWIADHRARVADLPVQSRVAPGEVAAALPAAAPTGTEGFAAVLDDLERVVVPGLTQTQSPRFFGWFPSNASLSAALGEMASAGLGGLGISWQSGPALTEVEQVVVGWLRELTGLSPAWHGTIHDSASTACLVALLVARERASGHSALRGGLQAEPAPLVVYLSPQAHSSVAKAALLAGFGTDNLRHVEIDSRTYAMRPDALRAAMAADAAAGRRPAAVVVTVGTTGTTAVDPLAELAPVAREHGAWVHVDAAMAGAALLLPECRWLVGGLAGGTGAVGTGAVGTGAELADSLSWNPHKWLGSIVDCALLYVRDVDELVRVMSTDPSYLRSAADGAVVQYRDWGIPLGRRFRALKLWFQLRLDGVDAIRARLRRDLANARWLAEQVGAEPGWRVLAPVALQTVCLRHEPGLAGAELDRHTLRWAAAVNDSGRAFVTPSLLEGRWMVRVSVGAEPTERRDVAELWALMRRAAAGESL